MLSTQEAGPFEKRRALLLFRIGIDILVFACLVILTAFLVRPLQTALHERLTARWERLIGRGADYLGVRIGYESMGYSLFGALDVRKLRVWGPGDKPLLSLSRLRVSYSLIELIKGSIPDSFHLIELDKPVLNLDEEQAAFLAGLVQRLQADFQLPGGTLALPRDLRVRVRNAEAAAEYQGSRFAIQGLGLDGTFLEDRITLRGRWNTLAGLKLFPDQEPLSVEMTALVSGAFDAKAREGSLSLTIPSLAGEGFNLRTVVFDLDVDPDRLRVSKQRDRFPFDLALDYQFQSRRVSGRLEARDFSPQGVLSLRGPWEAYNQYLSMSAGGTASFEAGGEEGLSYRLDLQGNMGSFKPVGPVSYTLVCEGDEEAVRVAGLELRSPRGALRYAGTLGLASLSPNGTLSIRDFSLAGDGSSRLDAELAVRSEGERISVSGGSLFAGQTRISGLEARLSRNDEGMAFSLSARTASAPEASVPEDGEDTAGQIAAAGFLDYQPRCLEISLALEEFPLGDLFTMTQPFVEFPAPADIAAQALKDARVTTEVFVSTDFERILYNAPQFTAASEGKGAVRASISGTDRRFDLNEVRLLWDGGSADASGFVDFSQGRDVSFSLRSAYLDVPYYIDGTFIAGRYLSIQGSYGLSAYIGAGESGDYSGYVKAESIPLPFGGQFAHLQFSSSLYYAAPEFWYVELERFALTNLATPASRQASLRVSGIVDQHWARLSRVVFDDGEGPLSGRAAFNWSGDRSQLFAQFRLENPNGEIYDGEGTYRRGTVDAIFYGERMRLKRFLRQSYNAVLTADARLVWNSPEAYSLTLNVDSLAASDRERNISLSAKAFVDEEELRVSNLSARYGNLQGELPLLRMNRREAAIHTGARVWGFAAGRELALNLALEARFAESASWFSFGSALEEFSGSLRLERFRFDALESGEPAVFTFARGDSALSVSGGPQDMFRFRLTQEGAFYAGVSAPSPVMGTITGTLGPRTIDAHSPNLYVDLESLWRVLPAQNILNCTGGFVNASVTIRGPLGDPEFFGTAAGHNVRLQVPLYLDAEIGPTPLLVELEGNEMRFGPQTTPVGAGAGTVSGWFRFDRWIPNVFSLDIDGKSDRPIPFHVDVNGIMVKGNTYGSLNLSQEDGIFSVKGILTGQDAEITVDVAEIGNASLAPNPNEPVVADIIVNAGRKVEFLWPSKEFPILRTYADVGDSLRIRSDSVTGSLSVTGEVSLRGGEIFYVQRNFYVREGTLLFNENELHFDPRLTVRAETRDRNEDGPVTISLLADNAPLMSFNARLESSPALSQAEILSLLGQNMAEADPLEDSSSAGAAIVGTLGDFISQFYLVRTFERTLRNFFRLDMLSFRTNVAQNVVLLPFGLKRPIDNNIRAGNYLDNTSVFLGKYFGSSVFAQAMFTLRYDENQRGFWGMGKELGMTPEFDIGIELQSPLFGIRFNVVPQHLENLFVNDMSFTLSWKRSF